MRGTLEYVFVGMSVLIIAGCGESANAPTAPAGRSVSPTSAITMNRGVAFSGRHTATFTLTANGGTFNIGNTLSVNFPANSVCDPTVSTYGPQYWDAPCQTLGANQTITLTATYGYGLTGPYVDFSPALRFSPDAQVILSTTAYSDFLKTFKNAILANPSIVHFLGIYYAPSLDASAQTDAATDPSLLTHINLTTGLVWRRVKHFSGYNVITGNPCDLSQGDPNCVDTGSIIIGQ